MNGHTARFYVLHARLACLPNQARVRACALLHQEECGRCLLISEKTPVVVNDRQRRSALAMVQRFLEA